MGWKVCHLDPRTYGTGMIIRETRLQGAYIVDLERIEDNRGFFARCWCSREFAQNGLETEFVQCNISFNAHTGTLRGMHYQRSPYGEAKLIRCTMGSIYDVIVDVRESSPTRNMWLSAELSQENRRMLYVPEGFAHGFLTLTDNTEVFYHMSKHYSPEHACGIRWDDPLLGIDWPFDILVISHRDRSYGFIEKNKDET